MPCCLLFFLYTRLLLAERIAIFLPGRNMDTFSNIKNILVKFYDEYNQTTPKKLKIVDAYLFYIMLTGIIQFVYCCLVGTFPFNSFLSGFISCVGSFVLGGKVEYRGLIVISFLWYPCSETSFENFHAIATLSEWHVFREFSETRGVCLHDENPCNNIKRKTWSTCINATCKNWNLF